MLFSLKVIESFFPRHSNQIKVLLPASDVGGRELNVDDKAVRRGEQEPGGQTAGVVECFLYHSPRGLCRNLHPSWIESQAPVADRKCAFRLHGGWLTLVWGHNVVG